MVTLSHSGGVSTLPGKETSKHCRWIIEVQCAVKSILYSHLGGLHCSATNFGTNPVTFNGNNNKTVIKGAGLEHFYLAVLLFFLLKKKLCISASRDICCFFSPTAPNSNDKNPK